jgi:hypothetical protein
VLAVAERARSFKAISPGFLSPLGIIFGLFVVFTAAPVWTDNEKARAEIDCEASALRSTAILATSFPRESQVQLRELIPRYIADVVAPARVPWAIARTPSSGPPPWGSAGRPSSSGCRA